MIDISSFIKSLKISWLIRLYWSSLDVEWANTIKARLPPIYDLVCYGTAKVRAIAKNKIKNIFWSKVLNAWVDFCSDFRTTPENILTDMLWFSDHTKFKTSIVNE